MQFVEYTSQLLHTYAFVVEVCRFHVLKQLTTESWHDANLLLDDVITHNAVRLARAGLTVGEQASVVALEGLAEHGSSQTRVDVLLRRK